MSWTNLKAMLLATAIPVAMIGGGLLLEPARADEPAVPARPGGAKRDLTPQSFATLQALIRPHDTEWRHLRVEWLTDVVAARKKAAAEDKPIVVCYTGGAGYNEPLGTC